MQFSFLANGVTYPVEGIIKVFLNKQKKKPRTTNGHDFVLNYLYNTFLLEKVPLWKALLVLTIWVVNLG